VLLAFAFAILVIAWTARSLTHFEIIMAGVAVLGALALAIPSNVSKALTTLAPLKAYLPWIKQAESQP
jgi:hypothetical protein